MNLSLYWISDLSCYVVANGVEDIRQVMTVAWGEVPDDLTPVLIGSDVLLAIPKDAEVSATLKSMGPAVTEAYMNVIHTAAEWVALAGRGLLIQYED